MAQAHLSAAAQTLSAQADLGVFSHITQMIFLQGGNEFTFLKKHQKGGNFESLK